MRGEWTSATSDYYDGRPLALPAAFSGNEDEGHVLSVMEFTATSVRVFPKVVLFSDSKKDEVVLSTGILSIAIAWLCQRVIDSATFRQLMTLVTGHYKKVPNLPPDRLQRSVLLTSLMAISKTVQLTNSVMFQFLWDYRAAITSHNELIGFSPRFSMTRATLVQHLAFFTIGGALHYEWPVTLVHGAQGTTSVAVGHVVAAHAAAVSHVIVPLGVATLNVPLVIAAWSTFTFVYGVKWLYDEYGGRTHERPVGRTWEAATPGEVLPAPVTPLEFKYAPVFGATSVVKPPGPVAERSKLVRQDVVPEKPPTQLMELRGLGFQFMPTYFEATQDNLVSALTARLVRPVPEPVKGAWSQAGAWFKKTRYWQLSFVDRNHEIIVVDKQAILAWAEGKYSVARKEELCKTFERLEASNFKLEKQDKAVSCFIKQEKAVALDHQDGLVALEHKEKAPRIIMSVSDAMLCTMGPICAQLATRFKTAQREYEGVDDQGVRVIPVLPFPTAPRACSVEVLSDWFVRVLGHLGSDDDVMVLIADGEAWDAHIGKDARNCEYELLFKAARIDPGRLHDMARPRMVTGGSASLRVSFATHSRRVTGQAETDIGNTTCNLVQAVHNLDLNSTRPANSRSGMGIDWFAGACGDDLFVLATRQVFAKCLQLKPEEVETKGGGVWKARSLRLGISSTAAFLPWRKLEFCSKVLYPTEDGLLLGGKIGRVLSRAGYFLDVQRESTPRAAAMSQLNDNYHVPFLRQYFTRVLQLLPLEKGRQRLSPEYQHTFHVEGRHEYGEETWRFLEYRYGLIKQDLLEFEALLASIKQLPAIVEWPRLADLVAVDDA